MSNVIAFRLPRSKAASLEAQRSQLVSQIRAMVVHFGAQAFSMAEYDDLHREITKIDVELEQLG